MTRVFVAGLLCAALVPATGSAQRVRDFEDSWFWGVKGGVSAYSPTLGDSETAATFGAEWLITRTHGALYVSVDQANIEATSAVFDPTADGSVRSVAVDKLRRVGFAALAFPKQFGRFRPYAGLGLSIDLIGDAVPLISGDETSVDDAVYERIDDRKSQAALLGMGGVQAQVGRAAVFGQASFIPANKKFLLDDSMTFFEFGVRYNFGGAREGIK
ncbi:MAG TPA: hypothetical protein VFT21_11995 [Gemmatimonadaceae bacterium]|nr:hypothetical protein [Gemmatimonadaceae bacterium]